MSKFKVGDMVKVIHAGSWELVKKGNVYEVHDFYKGLATLHSCGESWIVQEKDLELFVTKPNMNELTSLVTQWSVDKGIDKADPIKQYLKVSEEVGEIAAALSRNNREDLLDALGDSFVTLIVLCKQLDTTPTECLNMAYSVIKDRTGKVVDGVFIKKEDLK